jgi:hypothetical protein
LFQRFSDDPSIGDADDRPDLAKADLVIHSLFESTRFPDPFDQAFVLPHPVVTMTPTEAVHEKRTKDTDNFLVT